MKKTNNASLTNRELEVLRLIAHSYSNLEISQKLFISMPTVKKHISSILRKLSLRNRTEAVLYYYRNFLAKEV